MLHEAAEKDMLAKAAPEKPRDDFPPAGPCFFLIMS